MDDNLNVPRNMSEHVLRNIAGTDELSKLNAAEWKQTPHFATPKEEKKPVYDYELAQKLIKGVCEKVKKEKKIHEDINIKFDTDLGMGYKTFRRDDEIIILFGVWPHEKKELLFEVMGHALDNYLKLRGNVAVEMWSKVNEIARELEKLGPAADILSNWDVEIKCWKVVEVKHKSTGLVSVYRAKEGRGTSWTKLIASAKSELSNVIQKIKGGQ